MKSPDVLLFLGLSVLLLMGVSGCGQSDADSQKPVTTSAKAGSLPLSRSSLVVKHRLTVTPHPDSSELEVTDVLVLPETGNNDPVSIYLNSAFRLQHDNQPVEPQSVAGGISRYQLKPDNQQALTLSYKGKITSTRDCSWLVEACARLDEGGVFLDGNSHWYPQIEGVQHSFTMELELPEEWVSLSQGKQTQKGWEEQQPQRDIYLLAGKFKVYQAAGKAGQPAAMVYLQSDDPELAERYLGATERYIDEYSRLLGPYPYAKFATVESFWETGWGMPSFTLLGSRVMRLPFIIDTSFPHEILHNWWGNGVYVDSRDGNWSEGLTAYLADHRNKLLKGEDMNYRRDTLQKYAAFTSGGGDFPLSQFLSRHDQATQAVGYGKSLMLFHMLREKLGDEPFFQALRDFYETHRFKSAGFDELRASFEKSSGNDLTGFFEQWLNRSGAPVLSIQEYELKSPDELSDGKQQLRLVLQQSQVSGADSGSGKPFALDVPVVAHFKDGNTQRQTLAMHQQQQSYELTFPEPLASLSIDPAFDVFRIPDTREVPPALNVLFNREPKTFVLSRQVSDGMELVWDDFADTFSYGQDNMQVQYDDEVLPDSAIVVLLGGDNAMLSGLLDRAQQPFKLTDTAYNLNSMNYTCGLHSLALTLQAGEQQVILLDAPTEQSLDKLAQKLPHYGRYSYVLFNSATGDNVAKGQWEVKDSPLTLNFK